MHAIIIIIYHFITLILSERARLYFTFILATIRSRSPSYYNLGRSQRHRRGGKNRSRVFLMKNYTLLTRKYFYLRNKLPFAI